MKEKLKLDSVMNLSGNMAYGPNKTLLFRWYKISCEMLF